MASNSLSLTTLRRLVTELGAQARIEAHLRRYTVSTVASPAPVSGPSRTNDRPSTHVAASLPLTAPAGG
jgi:hypothetical protein